jgi:hypothetical protein
MALPKHKTCLSILRSILGPGAGNEARFAEKIGRSASWLKKASCGQIVLTNDAAVRIAYETGISARWLLTGDTGKPPADKDGKPYTLETYASHRELMRDGFDGEDALVSSDEMVGTIAQLLTLYGKAKANNRGGLFTHHLIDFADKLADDFGSLEVRDMERVFKSGERIAEDVLRLMSQNYTPTNYTFGKAPAPTPQKKQPSRKKRPA